ncbi:MAG: hypothetical protein WBW84_06315 [Acidobacteriaceae bacterium]
MYYIGLDVHKKTISYYVKDAAGRVHREGKLGATRCEPDAWIRTLPQPRSIAMEATIFTGWIDDHLLPQPLATKLQLTLARADARLSVSIPARLNETDKSVILSEPSEFVARVFCAQQSMQTRVEWTCISSPHPPPRLCRGRGAHR